MVIVTRANLQRLPNGTGRYLWADGRRYDGEFVAGERQGYGSLIWVSGDRYEGAFLANQMHGEGTFCGEMETATRAALWQPTSWRRLDAVAKRAKL